MRRDKLGDLYLIVQQRSDALFGLAHDTIDDFIRSSRVSLGVGVILSFLQHQPLAGNQLFELIRTAAHHVFLVGNFTPVFIEGGFARDNQTIAEKREQRRGRFIGVDSDGELVDGFRLGDGRRNRGFLL